MLSNFLFAIFILLIFIFVYLVINPWIGRRNITRTLRSAWDDLIPFKPVWGWFYFWAYVFNVVGIFVLLIIVPKDQAFRDLFAYFLIMIILVMSWVLFPVKVERMHFSQKDMKDTKSKIQAVIRWYQKKSPPYCSFPSLHTAFSLLTGIIYLYQFGPLVGIPMLTMGILIGLATLFTKQHCINDVIGSCLITAVITLVIF